MDKYFINDKGLLHKSVRGNDEVFHVLVVTTTPSECILHQVHDVL